MKTEIKQRKLEFRDKSPEFVLKLKPYIQPFEKYLAKAEVNGLVGLNDNSAFDEPATHLFRLPESSVDCEILKKRLAYWEQIDNGNPEPSFQVLLESEGVITYDNFEQVPFHRSRRLRFGPHGLHEYRGKFFPQLVKSLVNFAGLRHGDVVLDPMCGSGTTNCESRAMGMKTLGLDLNPLSVKLSRVKTGLYGNNCKSLSLSVNDILVRIKSINLHKLQCKRLWTNDEMDYLLRWFSEPALCELSEILNIIRTCRLVLLHK